MGQLCSFNDPTMLKQDSTLAMSWELCLRCLSRYTGLSSIADKSFHLLQESAKRLLVGPTGPPALAQPVGSLGSMDGAPKTAADMVDHAPSYNIGTPPMTNDKTATEGQLGQLPAAPAQRLLPLDHPFQRQLLDPALLGSVPGPMTLPTGDGAARTDNNPAAGLDHGTGEMWPSGHDPSGNSYWAFMPFLSQLESLPQEFDIMGFEPGV